MNESALPQPPATYNEVANVNTVTIRVSLDNGLFVNKVFESRWDADGHLEESALEQYEGFKRDLEFNAGKSFFKVENVSHYAGVTKIEEFYAVSTVTVTRKAA